LVSGVYLGDDVPKSRSVIAYTDGRRIGDPARMVGAAISDALDPTKQSSRVKRLADMSPEEIATLEKSLGAKVKR